MHRGLSGPERDVVRHSSAMVELLAHAGERDFSLRIEKNEDEIKVHRKVLSHFIPRFYPSSSLEHMQESSQQVDRLPYPPPRTTYTTQHNAPLHPHTHALQPRD